MRVLTVAVYAVGAAILVLVGILYPSLRTWSHWSGGVCLFYCLLSLAVATVGLAAAAQLAARFWYGLSTVLTVGLLLAFESGHRRACLIIAAAVVGLALLVTLAFVMLLRSNRPAVRNQA